MTEQIQCSRCECELTDDTINEFDEDFICTSCLEEETEVCDHCGDRMWRDDNYGSETRPLCQNCRDEYYNECQSCGRIVHQDYIVYDDYDRAYCENCYENREDARVPTSEIYSRYTHWAGDNGYKPLNNRNFVTDLRKRFTIKHDGHYGNVLHGVATAITQNIKSIKNRFLASHLKNIKSHCFPFHFVNYVYVTRVCSFAQC